MIPISMTALTDDDERDFIEHVYNANYRLMKYQIYQVTGRYQDIDDLIQDTILRLIPRVSLLRGLSGKQVRVYAVRTAKTVALNYLRSHNKQTLGKAEISQLPDSFESAYDAMEGNEAFHAMIGNLGKTDYDVLYMRYRMDMDPEEIGRLLGIKSIYQRLSRARKRLLELLHRGGWDDR